MAEQVTIVSSDAEQTFNQVEYHIQESQRLLRKEAERLREEKEAFESVAKKLKDVHFSSTIKLNVGGQFFTTSLQTLTKDAGSMLHGMFSGRFDTKPAEDGSYFIDRDGTHFRYILNYLRTGKLSLPDDRLVQKDVLEEARFFQIQGIIDELDRKHYSDSIILTSLQAEWLVNVHNDKNKFTKCSLLYRGSRDGWSASMFHAMCDSFNGPTMVVIKSSGGYVFGGYTEKSWSGNGFKADPAAFLFSLLSPSGGNPVQIKAVQNHQSAIYCNFGLGPSFGGSDGKRGQQQGGLFGSNNGGLGSQGGTTSGFGFPESQQPFEFGGSTSVRRSRSIQPNLQPPKQNPRIYDLSICDNPQSNNCMVNLQHTFVCRSGQFAPNFFTGSDYFTVMEMEVFGLEK